MIDFDQGQFASAVITIEPVGDEDGQVIEIPACKVTIVQNSDSWYYASTPVFHLSPVTKKGNTFLYTLRTIEGAITKGAKALWSDKHPDQDVPPLHGSVGTELAKRLRRKAKAVLDAAKAA